MNVTLVICKNLMDTSKISLAAKPLSHDVVIGPDIMRTKRMFLAGPGDRKFKIVLDYHVYESIGLKEYKKDIDQLAIDNQIHSVEYFSFVPHDLVPPLRVEFPDVNFVSRSTFFHNPIEYL